MKKKEKEKAVALRYDEHKDNAPKVVAKGEGYIARKSDVLPGNNIPVHRMIPLSNYWHRWNDYEIPPDSMLLLRKLTSWIIGRIKNLRRIFLIKILVLMFIFVILPFSSFAKCNVFFIGLSGDGTPSLKKDRKAY